jgi:hypothetical protein
MPTEKLCACGQPLHYSDPHIQELVERQIAELGEFIPVTLIGSGRRFLIPRHFLALHGIKGGDLSALAEQYGFEEVQ